MDSLVHHLYEDRDLFSRGIRSRRLPGGALGLLQRDEGRFEEVIRRLLYLWQDDFRFLRIQVITSDGSHVLRTLRMLEIVHERLEMQGDIADGCDRFRGPTHVCTR